MTDVPWQQVGGYRRGDPVKHNEWTGHVAWPMIRRIVVRWDTPISGAYGTYSPDQLERA